MKPDRLAFVAAAIAFGLITLALTLILQIPHISRIWLGWLPGILRRPLQRYFAPPPAIHPGVPDPALFAAPPNAEPHEKVTAAVVQIFLSAVHGIYDFGHYLARSGIAFIAAAIVVLAAFLMAEGIGSFTGHTM